MAKLNIIDVSGYQPGITTATLKNFDATIIKVTESNTYVNPYWKQQYAAARAAGHIVGLYCFAREGDSDVHADYFLAETAGYWGKGECFPVLDWEDETILAYPDYAVDWINRVNKSTGATSWLYTGLSGLQQCDGKFKDLPIWLPMYPYSTAQGIGAQASWDWMLGRLPSGYNIVAWQYSQTVNVSGWSSGVDASEFDGTLADLMKYTGKTSTATSSTTTATASKTTTTGLTWPVGKDATISQNFGAMGTSYSVGTGGHTGTDFAVSAGTSVKAMAAGTVLWADWCTNLPSSSWADRWYFDQANGGIIVLLDHGDYLSAYCHLSETSLNTGDTVKQGQEVAKSGNTGAATTGAHLHVEVIPKPLEYATTTTPLKIYGRVDSVAWIKSHTTTTTTAVSNAAAASSGDWFDMATEAELEAAVEKALNKVLDKAIPRKGKNMTGSTSIRSAFAWLDANFHSLHETVDADLRKTTVLHDLYRIGIPGRFTDGTLGAAIRKATGYTDKKFGTARQKQYDTEKKGGFKA